MKNKHKPGSWRASDEQVWIRRYIAELLGMHPSSISRIKKELGDYSPKGVRDYLLKHPKRLAKVLSTK